MRLNIFWIIITAIFFSCNFNKKNKKQISYQEKYIVKKINLRDVIFQTGEVQPVIKVEIKSEASGKINKVFVREGQQLQKGDTILIIDPQSLLIANRKNNLYVHQAKLERDIARRDFQNSEKMIKTGTISTKLYEDLKTKFESADIQYQLRSLELKDVVDQLNKTVIMSPMNGVITNLFVKEGEIAVSATSGFQGGTAIGTIADITNLEVITQIGEVDYIHLKEEQSVIIRPEAVEGVQTHGTISFLSMSATKKNGNELGSFEVRVSIDSLIPGIAAGINVNVEFLILQKNYVIAIPINFISKNELEPTVQVVIQKNGLESIEIRKVKLGATDYKNQEILSGLNEGEIIVSNNNPLAIPNKKQ